MSANRQVSHFWACRNSFYLKGYEKTKVGCLHLLSRSCEVVQMSPLSWWLSSSERACPLMHSLMLEFVWSAHSYGQSFTMNWKMSSLWVVLWSSKMMKAVKCSGSFQYKANVWESPWNTELFLTSQQVQHLELRKPDTLVASGAAPRQPGVSRALLFMEPSIDSTQETGLGCWVRSRLASGAMTPVRQQMLLIPVCKVWAFLRFGWSFSERFIIVS